MRVLRDVVGQLASDDEFVAVSHAPAVVDEEMTFDLLSGRAALSLRVKVLESRPVVVEGAVRHRLRLRLLDEAAPEIVHTVKLSVLRDGPAAEAL